MSTAPSIALEQLVPLIALEQARGSSFEGRDEFGPYYAYRLRNQPGSKFEDCYIFLSPEDWILSSDRWCGHLAGSNQHIEVRRRDYVGKLQRDTYLHHVIWERMGWDEARYVTLVRNPLDFRRSNLACLRGVVSAQGKWRVQIKVGEKMQYVGRATDKEEGYRMFNRKLCELKQERPEDIQIIRKPYNSVSPLF